MALRSTEGAAAAAAGEHSVFFGGSEPFAAPARRADAVGRADTVGRDALAAAAAALAATDEAVAIANAALDAEIEALIAANPLVARLRGVEAELERAHAALAATREAAANLEEQAAEHEKSAAAARAAVAEAAAEGAEARRRLAHLSALHEGCQGNAYQLDLERRAAAAEEEVKQAAAAAAGQRERAAAAEASASAAISEIRELRRKLEGAEAATRRATDRLGDLDTLAAEAADGADGGSGARGARSARARNPFTRARHLTGALPRGAAEKTDAYVQRILNSQSLVIEYQRALLTKMRQAQLRTQYESLIKIRAARIAQAKDWGQAGDIPAIEQELLQTRALADDARERITEAEGELSRLQDEVAESGIRLLEMQ